ncbi:hypothetical protein D3C72_1437370 [compost metagenome]
MRGGPPEPGLSLVLPVGPGRRRAGPLDLFEEPPWAFPRQRSVAGAVRDGATALHGRGSGRRRRLRGRCQPDQGRHQPPALRARRRRSAARGRQPRYRRVSGRAGRRGLRRRDPGDAQVHLTGRSGLALDRRQQGPGLLRLRDQLPDRPGPRDHRRCRAVHGGAPGRGDGGPHHDRACARAS